MTGTVEGEEDTLKDLPSQKVYEELSGSKDECIGEHGIEEMERKLTSYVENKGDMDRIKGALCHVYKMEDNKDGRKKSDYCSALYYWVSEIVWKIYESDTKSGSSKFDHAMNKYCTEIRDKEGEYGCKPPDPITDPKIREAMKKLFDFTVDKEFICTASGGADTPDGGIYGTYLAGVRSAYSHMQPECIGKGDGEGWCVDFTLWYGHHREEGTLQLKCNGILKPQVEEPATPGHSFSSSVNDISSGSTATMGSAVAGGLVSVALPTIGFFLYKYTDVFSGIKNSLFGGSNRNRGRGRRSTFRHSNQHFEDTLTENDSSTLGGGGGGESSTLGGSSTDISTIYNDDDGGRRRPSSPPSRKPYHTRQSRNIRYGRI
ncbi:KIR protein [Plasmodium knowlesi strain H]|uniref:KIR protein n=3 Tax=Plasmodium knowlesi TaxID=5850 RepID=A0A5K1VP92_PLAKH|nr:KIR protein [Plasmodium knowlesi strain H]OTN66506.1 KIR protein [Plasmodium knowlesi]CAA9986293.1 KIR protein [Plasmodium knowlesi strain H]SBO25518.1 KIR protein [Plasmodium knowlesi strain H]SBO28278.1 KIR protein [Plasmodium knowlesi strain H]VVS75767.1 KIR protein [Plasmodium knowlesi strain H]|eukprot:XP_002257698.1 KIR protein [Plasmodium knowlesi strain H]